MMTVTPAQLLPGSLLQTFRVEQRTETGNAKGQVVSGYSEAAGLSFRGVLASADAKEKQRWNQSQHPVTHTILHRGGPIAKEGDHLRCGAEVYTVQGVDNVGDVGIWTLYAVEKRSSR